MRSLLIPIFSLAAVVAQAADRPPNIVLISVDDVGREVLGSYGGTSYETPHLDALSDGMQFSHCFSMPFCHPSRITLLSGRYPSAIGNPKWGGYPKGEEKKTFAAELQRAG
ncbi:MAG: sulfatase-like hydrolase/transferase [Verrucomicrobiota bacterium]